MNTRKRFDKTKAHTLFAACPQLCTTLIVVAFSTVRTKSFILCRFGGKKLRQSPGTLVAQHRVARFDIFNCDTREIRLVRPLLISQRLTQRDLWRSFSCLVSGCLRTASSNSRYTRALSSPFSLHSICHFSVSCSSSCCFREAPSE